MFISVCDDDKLFNVDDVSSNEMIIDAQLLSILDPTI